MMAYLPIGISIGALVLAYIAESRTRRYQKGELQLQVVKREREVWKRLRAVITLAGHLRQHHIDYRRKYSGSWSESQMEASKRCLHRLQCLVVELEGGDTTTGFVDKFEKAEVDHDALCLFEKIDARLEDIELELVEIQGDLAGLREGNR